MSSKNSRHLNKKGKSRRTGTESAAVQIKHEGTTCFNDCKVGTLIAQGSQGSVYLLNDTYVVKITSTPEFAVMHNDGREWEISRRVAHLPGLAAAIDRQLERGYEFLKFVRHGPSLEDLLQRTSTGLPWNLLAEVGVQVVLTLGEVHDQGVLHRDIKPSNILQTLSGDSYVLVDFGHAGRWRAVGKKDHIPEVKAAWVSGTWEYVSLNLHRGTTASRRDDLIALAYTLADLHRGDLPWHGVRESPNAFNLIGALKEEYAMSMFKRSPGPLRKFYRAVSALSFDDDPDYAKYTKMLRSPTSRLTP